MNCKNCKFGVKEREREFPGLRGMWDCHKHAPVIASSKDEGCYSAWPDIKGDDSCGDFEEKGE